VSRSLPCAALARDLPEESPALEAELVARARTDPGAFAALYGLHHAAIARYVRRRVGDAHLASDIVAETFLTALEELHRYRERGLPFRAWLYRLASSRVNRWVRRRGPRALSITGEEAAREERSSPRHAVEIARRALLALPARYQTALALHYLEGLSVEEIATALGCRAGTVKARLSRGRERMRRLLAPHAEELFQ
jgi:RNA polymerase sigma-70 factor (ECF subfamily)